jgi:hypothetical protein
MGWLATHQDTAAAAPVTGKIRNVAAANDHDAATAELIFPHNA